MKSLTIIAAQIRPTRGKVLLESCTPPELYSDSTLIRSVVGDLRYPESAWVVRSHRDNDNKVRPNQLAILASTKHFEPRSYYDVFVVYLGDHKEKLRILVRIEAEYSLRQIVGAYRRNPSTDDKHISLQDVQTDEWYTFLASDVLDFGFEELANKTYTLEYMPTYMIELWSEAAGKFLLHYIIDERNIIGVIG